jgi:hypothetical protein
MLKGCCSTFVHPTEGIDKKLCELASGSASRLEEGSHMLASFPIQHVPLHGQAHDFAVQ